MHEVDDILPTIQLKKKIKLWDDAANSVMDDM